jgi:uncharacterized protein
MIDTLKQHQNEIIRLCEKHDVKEMYVFGSAATDTFGDHSDYDFLITFKDISVEKYTDNYFSLHKRLEELLGRKIDLLTDKSLGNPYFIQSVKETRQLLYAA